jgi:DNA-directed RNA polymerase subunit omega
MNFNSGMCIAALLRRHKGGLRCVAVVGREDEEAGELGGWTVCRTLVANQFSFDNCPRARRIAAKFFKGNFMARVTVEDCIRKIPNRYELIILASKRARQLLGGAKPMLETDNREIVTALREIAAGKVRKADTHYKLTPLR